MGLSWVRLKTRWGAMGALDKAISVCCTSLVAAFAVFLALIMSGKVGLLIVSSNSMAPSMPAGSLLVFRASGIDGLARGDIAIFRDGASSRALIAHRVVEQATVKGRPALTTRGDSNHRNDARAVGEDRVVGRGIAVVPYAGRLLATTKTPAGLLTLNLLLIVFIALVLAERSRARELTTIGSPVAGELVHPQLATDARHTAAGE